MNGKQKTNFVLGQKNFITIVIGFALIVLGFILMSGGASEDPSTFNEEIFNTQRLTVAPITVILGFIVIGFGIMIKPKEILPEEIK